MRPYLGNRILEVGAGLGTVADEFTDKEHVILLDNDPVCVRKLRARFADAPNVHVLLDDILEPATVQRLVTKQIDTVLRVNVLEHIEDDAVALASLYDVLEPGGCCIILVPAMPVLYGAMDRRLGHVRRYQRTELVRKVTEGGFALQDCRYFNSIGAAGWYFAGRVRKQAEIRAAQVRQYDQHIVPLLARVEAHVRPAFGQSLLAVARKL